MIFALLYLLLFLLDILASSRFLVLGMIPMDYWVASVGFFCGGLMMRKWSFIHIHFRHPGLTTCFLVYMILTASLRFCEGSSRLLLQAAGIDLLVVAAIPDVFLLAFHAAAAVLVLALGRLSSTLSRWMCFSAAAGGLHYAVLEIYGGSILLHRYDGVLDLVMLFGWLMIVHTLLRKEYGVEDVAI
jgi:hypothetical protein